MYCTCGAPWCDARNLCSADLGTSMSGGHRKVREDGGRSCGPDCGICHPPTLIPGTSVNWGPVVWPTEFTARIPAVVSLSTEGDPF